MKINDTLIPTIIIGVGVIIMLFGIISIPFKNPLIEKNNNETTNTRQEQLLDTYVIINRSFDASGTVILDFAVNGNPRTAYFPSLNKCNAFVDYLATLGKIEYLGGE